MAAVDEEPTSEAFHEWRKRVKYHRYHVRMLRDAWPAILDPWREQLHQLSDLLGEDHDLAVLGGTLERYGAFDEAVDRSAISALIDRRRTELQARAHPLGERLLAEKPGRLVRRLSAYWEAWRRERETVADDVARSA
jgi:CHAD domain-containing protein